MASMWFCCLLVGFLRQTYALGSVFDRILDNVQPCKDMCDQTYPLHTYPDAKHLDCCNRGCRFFSLVEFINDGQNVNATKDACMASCMEAYSQTSDRYACNIGCSNEVPFAVERQKKMHSEPASMHLLTPFMYVHNIYNNMIDRMSRMMSVSWSFYFQQDDGKIIVFQSEPEIISEFITMDEIDYDKNQDESNDSGDESGKEEESENRLQLEKTSAGLRHTLPDVYHYQENSIIEPSRTDYAPEAYNSADEIVSNTDWLGCVARKSGLPRWLIGLTILFSAMAMIWLCFTATVTAPDHHLRPQKLSIYGDLEYLRLYEAQEKICIQPHQDEAPPLPVKIHIQHV